MRASHKSKFLESLIAAANDDHDQRLGDSIAKRIKSLKQMINSPRDFGLQVCTAKAATGEVI
jgi:hypothetical protein